MATVSCNYFLPFYYYEPTLYAEGVLVGNAGLTFYNLGLYLTARRPKAVPRFALAEMAMLSNFTLVIALLLDLVTLSLYGTAILPGVRTTGLQQAAAGSQVFFALVSSLTVVGFGLAVACALIQRGGAGTVGSVIRIIGFFAISMLFYQRGALLLGGVLGLFIVSRFDPLFYRRQVGRTLIVFIALMAVALLARPAITAVVSWVEPRAQIADAQGPVVTQTTSCRIANTANQEHDQVWPTTFTFVDRYGPDYFRNILAAFLRPFLNAELRDRLGFTTSADTLNLYNDARVYLEYNFGFSVSSYQYYYFSAGMFSLPIVFIVGIISSRFENSVGRRSFLIDYAFLRHAIVVLNLVYLFASPVDEQLKWAVINIVTAFAVTAGFQFLRRLGEGSIARPPRTAPRFIG